MEESHSYWDFQNIIKTANQSTNERIDLLEVYFNQVLKENSEFRRKIDKYNKEITEFNIYINWYISLPWYKLFWYKICNKNINEIYLKKK